MAVNKNDIDFLKASSKISEGKSEQRKSAEQHPVSKNQDDDFLQTTEAIVKKKDTPSLPPSKEPLDGAVPAPGTTNTIKWEDNPLNPVKAVNDYEEKRDKIPEILFKDSDNEQLNTLLAKYKVAPAAPVTKPLSWIEAPGQPQMQQPVAKAPMQIKFEDAVNLENTIKAQLENYKDVRLRARGIKKTREEENAEKDLQEAQLLKRKAATELVVNGDKEIEVNTRTNEIGNSFNQFMSDLISLNQPVKGKKFNVKETEDKVRKMPTQFLTGVNMLKLTEPAEYERVTESIANGLPVSASQTAKITALGLNIEQAKLERDILKAPITQQEKDKYAEVSEKLATIKPDIDKYEEMIKAKLTLSPEQVSDYNKKIQQYNQTYLQSKPLIEKINSIETAFSKKASELQEARRKNLIDNPEVLRAFISDGVAEKLDELGKIKQGVDVATGGKKLVSDFMFGHTWNYSPDQIQWAAENYLKEQGIDPTTKQAQDAIKFLQENEGVMIGENSIAKAGGFRELGEGIIEPITGTAKSIKDRYRSFNDIYAESQSQGNVDVAKKRLASEDTGIRSVVNDVLKGTGQFASQAAIMYATSGGIGAIAESILGKSGVEWLAQAKAANIKPVVAFDDASANLAAGKFLYRIKDPMAVFTTSFAMSYDGNLKAALSYTSDNTLAKRAAIFNASMEGATELFLSPLDIARGIIHKFSKNQTKDLLKILSDKSLKDEPGALKEYVGKFVRGVLGTSKVAGAEIGEEFVTQISDYVTNMYLNPDSDSFKNRDLKQELMTTAYQTGLTMAVPAILNGIGAMKANSFSKGSLMIAAQNRQKIVDGINKDLAAGKISPEQANEQIQLVNTAAVANAQLPKKANGAPLNTDEKANYIWSLTTEAYMDKKMASMNDAAAKEIWKDKILKQQEYRKQIIGLKEEQPEVPEYLIDDKPVSREEFLKTIEEKPDGNYVVAGDEEAQAALRKIGGIDDKTDSEVTTAVIEIGGKMYEGKNHAEAILKAKADGKDISKVDRKKEGKFKLADGTIIDRAEAKKRFGQDRSELLIEQDEAADNANKEYRKTDKDLVNEVQDKNVPGYEKTGINELKDQALGAPASLKNQFDDEELVVDLISRNSEQQIEYAIKYQEKRLEDPNLSELELKEADKHIALLVEGQKRQKEFAENDADKTILAARKGDKAAQETLTDYGLTWEEKPKYRIIGQTEKDILDKEGQVKSNRDSGHQKTDVTDNPDYGKVGGRADETYRIKFKETEKFDSKLSKGKVKVKNAEEGEFLLEGEYTLDDIESIEVLREDKTGKRWEKVETEKKDKPKSKLEQLKAKKKAIAANKPAEKILKPTDTGRDIAGNYLHNVHRYNTKQLAQLLDESREYVKNNPNDKFVPEINRRIAELEKGVEKDLKLQEIATQRGRSFTDTGKWVDDSYVDAPAENQLGTVTTSSNLWDIVFDSDGKMKPYTAAETLYFNPGGEGQIARSRMQHPDKQGGAVNLIFDRQSLAKDGIEVDKTGGEVTISQEVPLTHLFPEAKIKAKDAILNEAEFRGIELSKEQLVHIDKVLGIEKPPPSSKSKPDSKPPNKPSENKPIVNTEEPRIKDVNLNKQIDLLSADFLDINKPEIAPSSQRIKIVDVPLSSISTDTSSFQNRETEFSQESVDKILKAVQEDNFNWTEFDPVTLWKNDNNLFMLSGHSRLEAFKRLTTMGYAGFDTIPSEIFEGTKEDAIAIALRSNTLSTKETPIERAGYYRDARLKGVASRSILNEAKDYEGRNALTIIALSYLNPKGKAIADLKALGQEGDTKSKANSLQMARWVGEVRQQFPQVTDAHENEIYDWLKAGAYAKIKNLAEISSRINNVVSGFDFDAEKPLNLEHRATKSYVDETYEQQLSDKEKQIKEQQKLISDKATKYNEAKLTPQEVAEKLVPDNAILARMQQDYIKLKDKKGAISEANKGILSLFDNIQTEIDNGTITEQQAESFINTTDEIEESDPIIEDIERNAESEITASQAIEEGIELINGENVIKNREVKAEKKLAEKVSVLEKEKTARINEITKPELNMNTLLINDLFTMAATNEANRQEYEDIKSQFFSLKNLFDCLFA